NFAGDYARAAADLAAGGYGSREEEIKFTRSSRAEPPPPRPSADNSDDPLDADATAADLVAHLATVRWRWEGWLPLGVLTILASERGVGKTRLCADLLRRVANGLPWPDGSPMLLPKSSPCLWVPADNNHAELGTLPADFGFPRECLFLNAT